MDYDSLIAPKGTPGSIANWVNFSDALLPLSDILEEAQALIYDMVRLRAMYATRDLAVTGGEIAVDLPDDLMDLTGVWDQFQSQLAALDQISLERRRAKQSDGTWETSTAPTAYAMFGEQLQFDLAPDADITLRISGAFQPAMLGPTNKTNWLTKRYPHILRPACVAKAADFLNDQVRYDRAFNQLAALLKTAQQSDDMAVSGMQVDVYPAGSMS